GPPAPGTGTRGAGQPPPGLRRAVDGPHARPDLAETAVPAEPALRRSRRRLRRAPARPGGTPDDEPRRPGAAVRDGLSAVVRRPARRGPSSAAPRRPRPARPEPHRPLPSGDPHPRSTMSPGERGVSTPRSPRLLSWNHASAQLQRIVE